MSKSPILKYVEVKWMDAHSTAQWVGVDEALPPLVPCVSRGWLIEDKPSHVTLAGTLALNSTGDVSGFGEVISIPRKGFVLKVRKVKL